MKLVITGAGIVSAIGIGKEATLQHLQAQKTGIAPVQYLQTAHQDTLVGEVKYANYQLKEQVGIAPTVPMSRTAMLGVLALREALQQAGLPLDAVKDCPLISGTTVGGMDKSEQHYLSFFTESSPAQYIKIHDCGSSTEQMAEQVGGFNMLTTLSTACSSAANAFVLGVNILLTGEAQCVVVGGSECLSKFHLNGFKTLMIVDNDYCKPFDANRAGLNLGEGAAFMVLETEQSAQKRGATILAYLSGYGNACDAHHQTASSPTGDGAYLSMSQAVEMAGLQPADISYVNAHGTGTPNNDPSECAAMSRLFGNQLPPFSSTKGFTGHTTSASGAIELVISLLALQHQFLPVSLHWQTPFDPQYIPVTQSTPAQPLKHVLCNSFGFGGNDTSLILSLV